MKKILVGFWGLSFILILFGCSFLNNHPDTGRFYDSAHHWYDINDVDKLIKPLPDRPVYDDSEYVKIADNILLFQKNNGGWEKNYDMRAKLTPEQANKIKAGKECDNTTYDNGATHTQLSYLAEVYTLTNDEKYKNAFLKGLDFIFESQYDNGGFPQKYPDSSSYHDHITFNDGAMGGVMFVLRNIVYKDPAYLFVDSDTYNKAKVAFDKGIDCILKCQIVENGVKTVWCQQHDKITLEPRPARTFEPAAICNMESAGIIRILMDIPDPDQRVKEAVNSAIKWYEDSAIEGLRVETFDADQKEFVYRTSKRDRRVVMDKNAPRIWARFYELGTHVPLFCRRDGRIVYSMKEVERERREGYAWYHYVPEYVLDEYKNWNKKYN